MGILGPEVIAKPVDPDAAIEFWRQRAKLTDAEAKALGAGAKQRAFYVSGLARRDLVQLVSDGIQTALENGETLADFKGRIAGAIAAEGWHGYRVENIFRTNMQTAYAAGRYEKNAGGQGVPALLAISGDSGQANPPRTRHITFACVPGGP